MNTENLDLRIITAEETPSWLTDFNGNMDKIDTFAGIAKSVDATIQTDLENLHSADNLITTKLDGVTTRVETLETSTNTNETDISNLKSTVGTMQTDLITQNTAIKQAQTDISRLKTDVTDLRTDVDNNMGDISAMQADVSTATTKADNAKATADSANSTASSALTTSETALHQAENAQYAADSAETKADNASSLANDALTNADSAMSRANFIGSAVADSISCAVGSGQGDQVGTRVVTWSGAPGLIVVNFAHLASDDSISTLYTPGVFYINSSGLINGMPKNTFFVWSPGFADNEETHTMLPPTLKIRSYNVGTETKIEAIVEVQTYPYYYSFGLHLIEDIPLG